MDRKEIKSLARQKIKGNLWNILWPALVIMVVESIIEEIFHLNPYAGIKITDMEALSNVQVSPKVGAGIAVVSLIIGIFMVAYKKYILNFLRGKGFDAKEILNCIKEKWVNILVAELLMGLVVFACTLLFVIPGIIMALAYAMVTYIVIDTELSGVDSLKKSREMMNGYKWNYFVFGLSFIGWFLLVPFTLGLLLIWLYPYVTVADAIYYEQLKEKNK